MESKKSRVGYNSLLRARLPRGSSDSFQIDLSEGMSRGKEEEGEEEMKGRNIVKTEETKVTRE